ncbi:MAG: ATP-binding protein, partial [Desulfobacterales bacterium]
RLQTERDKERVLAGLEGAAAGTGFDRGRMEEILAGLGKRVFLLNNVNENAPVTFETRWVLSYLRGPMTRDQIKVLVAEKKSQQASAPVPVQSAAAVMPGVPAAQATNAQVSPAVSAPPVIAPDIKVMYLAGSGAGQGLVYYPAVAGWLDIHYASAKYKIDSTEEAAVAVMLEDGPVPLDWDQAQEIRSTSDNLQTSPLPGAGFAELPSAARKAQSYRKWNKDLLRWIRQNRSLNLYQSKRFKLSSNPSESKGEFLARVSQAAREQRDLEVEKLRRKYSSKFDTLQQRLMRAEQALQREKEQATSKKMETVISFGTAILGAFLGRKTVSTSSATRFGTAVRSAGRMRKESMDVARAQETADAVKQQLAELDQQLQSDINGLEAIYDPAAEQLDEVMVKPKSTDITLEAFGLVWMPYRKGSDGRLSPDWQ